MIATLADNLIHDQTSAGVHTETSNGAVSTVTLSGNTITRNAARGVDLDSAVTVQTPQNNVVINNVGGDLIGGSLTTIPLH